MMSDRRPLPALAGLVLALLGACAGPVSLPPDPVATPPVIAAEPAPAAPVAARKPYTVESPNGARNDPYYWLRDDTRQSVEVLDHLKAENAYADALMAPLRPLQEQLYQELIGRIPQEDRTVPVLDRGYLTYTRFEAGREYPIHARRRGSMDAPEQVLLDGNALAAGHAYFQIGGWAVSPDQRLLAYAEDTVGRRQYTLKVRNLDSGEVLADRIVNADPDLVWAADSRTLLYVAKDPVTLLGNRVLSHRIGAAAADDAVVYEEPDTRFRVSLGSSKSERFLFIELQSTLVSEWRYAEAADPALRFGTVLPREPEHEYDVEHHGRDFIIRSNWQAPNFRIVRAPIGRSADKQTWKDVLAHRRDALIEDFQVFDHGLAVDERSGGLSKLRVQAWRGEGFLLPAQQAAYTQNFVYTPALASGKLRYSYSSLTTPNSLYEFDWRSGRTDLLKADAVPGGFDAAHYVTEYLHATAADGAQIPVSIVYRKGVVRDGRAPLYQYAYGSYGVSVDPAFRSAWLSLLDRGFVVAIAHVRGGAELGRHWYEAGRQLRKKNSFSDFIDVTDYLVEQKIAAPDKVFAAGRSAGGMLMGAVANLAPQKYRGIVAGVPFVDVVTTMLDETIPLTTNEFDEWGNPQQKPFYDYMLSYSPYDNVRAQDYPAMLVTTGLWDSQVQYFEPAKWVARLRAAKTDDRALVFAINLDAGHGGSSGRFRRFEETAQEYAFILGELGQ